MNLLKKTAIALSLLLPLGTAHAAPWLTITNLSADSDYNNRIALIGYSDAQHTTPVPLFLFFDNGSDVITYDGNTLLAFFINYGDPLVFQNLPFVNGSPLANAFYTDNSNPALQNPDGIIHAFINELPEPNSFHVAFEDLLGGGDFDYNDAMFNYQWLATGPVTPGGGLNPAVPEPATGLLLSLGFGALALGRRRKVHSAVSVTE